MGVRWPICQGVQYNSGTQLIFFIFPIIPHWAPLAFENHIECAYATGAVFFPQTVLPYRLQQGSY